jgi:hypothetical protein
MNCQFDRRFGRMLRQGIEEGAAASLERRARARAHSRQHLPGDDQTLHLSVDFVLLGARDVFHRAAGVPSRAAAALFEETVVDRYGLWEYMPYYRVGRLCSWDIGAMVLIGFMVWRVFRRAGRVVRL